jgi:hypothetical protein
MVVETVGSVSVPPIEDEGPTESTGTAPLVGSATVQVTFRAYPALFESGSISRHGKAPHERGLPVADL